MGRILLFGLIALVGLVEQAITRPTIPDPVKTKVEEVSFVEDVSLEIPETLAADSSQPAAPLVVPEAIKEDIQAADLQVSTVAALPCADGSCRRGPLQALGAVVKERPGLFPQAHQNAQDRRSDRRERWASRPGVFGRRACRRC